MKFKVIDKKTGKEADVEEIALHEDWAKGLVYCDIEGFAITEDGELILADECGKFAYCPDGRFEVQFDADELDSWTPVGERLPEGKIDPMTNDFELVLCSTVWEVVRPYKFGKPIGHSKAHFWSGGGIMDDYVIAWKPMPEPYKEAEHEV